MDIRVQAKGEGTSYHSHDVTMEMFSPGKNLFILASQRHLFKPMIKWLYYVLPLLQVLDSLQDRPAVSEVLSKTQEVTCRSHKEKMSVYCETCRESICHKCALWGVHKGHSTKPLDDFYKGHVELLQGEVSERVSNVAVQLSYVLLLLAGKVEWTPERDCGSSEVGGKQDGVGEGQQVQDQERNEPHGREEVQSS